MSQLPVLLQLAMTQRRDVVPFKLLVLARVLLLVFPHCEEPRLYPPWRHLLTWRLLRRLVDRLGDGGL